MADAHFLYIVMAVVLFGLVSWAIAVNIWAPRRAPVLPSPDPPPPGTAK
ncbi:MAG TPA: hypothetical protein VK841_18720 [Polyangiaceae bacterium]|jgi:hypothetical protein|nr:hypothetical protein [Polyangiaceae bacterium]